MPEIVGAKLVDQSGFPRVFHDDVPDHWLAQCFTFPDISGGARAETTGHR
jgi:hypothetical protein